LAELKAFADVSSGTVKRGAAFFVGLERTLFGLNDFDALRRGASGLAFGAREIIFAVLTIESIRLFAERPISSIEVDVAFNTEFLALVELFLRGEFRFAALFLRAAELFLTAAELFLRVAKFVDCFFLDF
jgi:hypothetical protein